MNRRRNAYFIVSSGLRQGPLGRVCAGCSGLKFRLFAKSQTISIDSNTGVVNWIRSRSRFVRRTSLFRHTVQILRNKKIISRITVIVIVLPINYGNSELLKLIGRRKRLYIRFRPRIPNKAILLHRFLRTIRRTFSKRGKKDAESSFAVEELLHDAYDKVVAKTKLRLRRFSKGNFIDLTIR